MRRLTVREVNEQFGGKLPPDAVFRADAEPTNTTPAAKPTRRTKRGERFAALNTFTDCSLSDLTGSEVKVWLILFRDTKAATGTARTGQADLARRAGLSVRGAQIALGKLQEKGLVQVIRRGCLNAGPSTYRVHSTSTNRIPTQSRHALNGTLT
jgi:hypothetical protein